MHNTSIVPAGNPLLYDRNKNTSSTTTSTSVTMQQQINNLPVSASFHGDSFAVKTEGSSSHHNNMAHQFHQYPFVRGPVQAQDNCGGLPSDMDSIKAKIVAHPQYSSLLDAFMSCQKVVNSTGNKYKLDQVKNNVICLFCLIGVGGSSTGGGGEAIGDSEGDRKPAKIDGRLPGPSS